MKKKKPTNKCLINKLYIHISCSFEYFISMACVRPTAQMISLGMPNIFYFTQRLIVVKGETMKRQVRYPFRATDDTMSSCRSNRQRPALTFSFFFSRAKNIEIFRNTNSLNY